MEAKLFSLGRQSLVKPPRDSVRRLLKGGATGVWVDLKHMYFTDRVLEMEGIRQSWAKDRFTVLGVDP